MIRRFIKLTLLLCITLTTTHCIGQAVEFNKSGFFINSRKVPKVPTSDFLLLTLGKPDRKYLNTNTIWVYDNIGIRVYFEPSSDSAHEIDIDLVLGEYDFSPKNSFTGELIFYENRINSFTPSISIKKIPDLNFMEILYDKENLKAEIEHKIVYFMYYTYNFGIGFRKGLQTIGISFE